MNCLIRCVFLASFLTVGASLVCKICQENSCAEPSGWISQTCPPNTQWCYSLMNNRDKVYRAGCSPMTCDSMQKSYDSKCANCDSDECNAPQILNANQPRMGGGVTWNTASSIESKISLVSSIATFVLIFLLIR